MHVSGQMMGYSALGDVRPEWEAPLRSLFRYELGDFYEWMLNTIVAGNESEREQIFVPLSRLALVHDFDDLMQSSKAPIKDDLNYTGKTKYAGVGLGRGGDTRTTSVPAKKKLVL